MRIYLDSNVFISFFNKEIGRKLRGLFIEAEEIFDLIAAKEYAIVVSELCIKEIKKQLYLSKKEIKNEFKKAGIKTIFVKNAELIKKDISSLAHFPDSWHIQTALNNKCEAIITFNEKDFEEAKQHIKVISSISQF